MGIDFTTLGYVCPGCHCPEVFVVTFAAQDDDGTVRYQLQCPFCHFAAVKKTADLERMYYYEVKEGLQ